MRVSTATIYTLATLAGQDLSLQAQATPSFKPSTTEPTFSNVVLNDTTTSALSKPIAPPEMEIKSRQLAQSRLIAQPISLTDIHNHRAQGFIEALAARQIVQGFPDGKFRPDQPVTRAQFAAMVQSAFSSNHRRAAVKFVDVPTDHWAYTAIQDATEMGFLAGYPGHAFNPNQYMPRLQALVSLVKGLKLSATGKTLKVLKTHFQDAANIPNYARDSLAAAAERRIVYPNSADLKPYQVATRADVAVFIYQALVSTGELPPLDFSAIALQ